MPPTVTRTPAGTSKAHRPVVCTAVIVATRMPTNIAMPPTSGISPICCLRPPGLSVMQRRTARGRSVSVKTTVIANASAVDNDSPHVILCLGPEHPEILLDDPAVPLSRGIRCADDKSDDDVTFFRTVAVRWPRSAALHY